MKTELLQLTKMCASIAVFCLLTSVMAQETLPKLIEYETSVGSGVDTDLHFFSEKQAVLRYREVKLNGLITSPHTFNVDDRILLNFFENTNFTAKVRNIEENVMGTVVITADILESNYAYAIISTHDDRSLINVFIPETGRCYQIISDPVTLNHFIIEMDETLVEKFDEHPSLIPPPPSAEVIKDQERIQQELEKTRSGPYDPANIDVMIVFTPAARTWANTSGGGIYNRIATAMATAQLVLSNSQTFMTIKLVHTAEISYTEYTGPAIYYGVPYNYWASGPEVDLIRLREGTDGFAAVHTWRNTYGADLCQLYSTMGGGIGWILNTSGGNADTGFSISGVGVTTSYTPIHEMAHNMGCGHHKAQNFQPGPGLFTFSAGWRWTGTNGIRYCDIMTYESGTYFPDGLNHSRVPYFSNPTVNYWNVPTGHSVDGDNAWSLMQVKHVIAAYRPTATINCLTCPAYDIAMAPNSNWNTHSSSIVSNGCYMYRVNVIAGHTYTFQTGCGNGATANFDTYLELYDSNCTLAAWDDDGCGNYLSKIEWMATYSGYAYLKVRGYTSASGSYTLAFHRGDDISWIGQTSTNWNFAGNWSRNVVPDNSFDVSIPAGTLYNPNIYLANASCKSLIVETGATLNMGAYNLVVSNDVNIYGTLNQNNTSSKLYVYGSIFWQSGSTATATASATIYVQGSWDFNDGANVLLTGGYVDFFGDGVSYIRSKDADSHFNHVRNFKTGTILGHSGASTYPCRLNGNLYIYANCEFRSYTSQNFQIGNLVNNMNGIIALNSGTFVFDGVSGSSSFMEGDYFNNVTISSTGTTTFNNNVEIRGNLLIESGALSLGGTTLTLKGNWTNSVGVSGLIPGTSTVVFHSGGNDQDVYGLNTFYNATQINASKYLRFNANTTIQNNLVLNFFCWGYQNMVIQGVLDISNASSKYTSNGSNANTTIAQLNQGGTLLSNGGGSIYVSDLAQNYLWGTIEAGTGSFLDITNSGTGTWVDLKGKLINNGGTINISGTDAYWPYANGAELIMTAGVVDLKTSGLYIPSTAYTWTCNITGGTIRTSGGYSGNRADFNPTAGTFEFYGSSNYNISQVAGSTLPHVKINKGAAKDNQSDVGGPVFDERSGMQLSDGGKANSITLSSNFTITGNLNIAAGTFSLGNFTCNVGGTTDVYGTLAMTNAANDLTAGTINWQSGSNDNVTAGTFHTNNWRFNEGTNAKLGTGNTAFVYTLYYPTDNDAEFGNLVAVSYSKVSEGGEIGKASYPVRVAGNFDMQGTTWNFTEGATDLIVSGNSNIPSGNNLYFYNGADFSTNGSMNLAGTLSLSGGGVATLHGALTFPSTGNLYLNASSFICDQNSASESITLNGRIDMNAGSVFEISGRNVIIGTTFNDDNIGGGTIRFGRSITAGNPNNFQLNWGNMEMISANSGHYIDIGNGNYVNHLFINKNSADIYLLDHLTMKGYFTLNSGVFNSNNKNMYVGGNWTNNVSPAAFLEQTGTVYFNGSGDLNHQKIFGETFYNLTNAKTGNAQLMIEGPVTVLNIYLANGSNLVSANLNVNGLLNLSTGVMALTTAAPTVTVNNFTMGGNLSVANGNFTCTDIVNNGIFGTIDLYNGSITLNQDATHYTDLNGSLNIHGGTMTVNGGNGHSEWGWIAPASFTMSNGILDFNNPGIAIDVNRTITASVSGGTIRTSGMFWVTHPNFIPSGGTAELYGSNPYGIRSSGGSHFYNLKIDKQAAALAGVDTSPNEDLNNVAQMRMPEPGRLKVEIPLDRSDNYVTTIGNLKVINNTVIDEGRLRIIHESTNGGNLTVNPGGMLALQGVGSLAMGSGKALTVHNGGGLSLQGSVSNYPKITSISGNYSLNIENAATIAAEYAIFEYMNTNGVNIKSGAIVDPANAFSNCILRNGQSGGKLLTINNNQTLLLSNVNFPGSSGNFNVSKTVSQGVVVLTDYSGAFALPANEQDSYNRIHWTGTLSPTVVLDGVLIGSGQDMCFEATQTITVGGTQNFQVESGGNVNLIAGQNVRMLPGTRVHNGGYLHAWITTDGIYCGGGSSMLAVIEENSITGYDLEETIGQSNFKVYPNPTTGIFTLEFLDFEASSSVLCEIYDIMGKRVWYNQLPANTNYLFDLTEQQPGIYFIRIMLGSEAEVIKLVRQ